MRNKEMTSARIRKDFKEAFKHLPGGTVVQEEMKVIKKPSFLKRAAMYGSLSVGLGIATVFAVDAVMPEYDGVEEVKICWACTPGDGVYRTPQEAIKAINPHANERMIALIEDEFLFINELPHDDYSMFLKAGEYKIPVIK